MHKHLLLKSSGRGSRAHKSALKSYELEHPKTLDDLAGALAGALADADAHADKRKRAPRARKDEQQVSDDPAHEAPDSDQEETEVATKTSPKQATRKRAPVKPKRAKTAAKTAKPRSSNGESMRSVVRIDDLPDALLAEFEAAAKTVRRIRNSSSYDDAYELRQHSHKISNWARRWVAWAAEQDK